MSGLADRLVTAAAMAIQPAHGPATRRQARLAAAAALGQAAAELRAGFLDTDQSDYGKGWKDAYEQVCNDLELWSEVIEKGEQT